MNNDKLNELVKRVHGDLYVGVLGSVRSGKSTFINKFMNLKILPYIDDEYLKNKIVDELPQTSEGKQITTVEPKFVPSQSCNVNINDITMNLRFVDSVGYVIKNSQGYETEDGPRFVKTPWFEEPLEFKEAAKVGTKKIIENHSNLGIVLTSDGTFGEFTRRDYEEAEEDVIMQMKALNKPFVIVLNTEDKNTELCKKLVNQLKEKYNESVYACNVKEMTEQDVDHIISQALEEFPIEEIVIDIPAYVNKIGDDIKLKADMMGFINETTKQFKKIKEVNLIKEKLKEYEWFNHVDVSFDEENTAVLIIKIEFKSDFTTRLIYEITGMEIDSQEKLIEALYMGQKAKMVSDEIGEALKNCKEYGYGVMIPSLNDMKLLPPSIIKQSGRYGVNVQAIAPSIHLIKVDVEASFSPIIGSLEQSKTLIESLDDLDPNSIWEKEIFGRKLSEIVNDGIKQKIYALPMESKDKLKDVMTKLLNSERSSLITIIL